MWASIINRAIHGGGTNIIAHHTRSKKGTISLRCSWKPHSII